MKRFIFLIFIFLCQIIQAQKFQDTIPFRNDLGLIIIPITFNGVEKQFAFDTGAQYSVAYDWAKEDLKKTNKTLTVVSSSNLRSKMRFYKSGTITIGSRKITGHRILNAPKNDIFSCYEVDGILGVDIIKALNWRIDYKNKTLIMYPADYFPDELKNMHELDFDFSNDRPSIYLKRKDNKLKFLLDTGAGGYSNISQKNYNLRDVDEIVKTELFTGSFDVNGMFTSTKPKVIAFPESTSENVILSPIMYYNNQKSSKLANRLWEEKSLFLSLKNDKLYVSSSRIKQIYNNYPCSVLYQNGKMRIMSIEKGSDLWDLGVRQGDEILKYDGKQFTDFCSLDQYQREIANSEKSFTLQLSNGEIVTVSKMQI